MSAIVIRTSKSGSSAKERICFLMASRIEDLSNRLAISRSILTQTSLIFGTGYFEAEIIRESVFSTKAYPCTERQISFSE